MNHKRGKPRNQVRCQLCTDGRYNIGGDRRLRKLDAQRDIEEARKAAEEEEEERFWKESSANPANGVCPDCKPPGSGKCDDCPDGICVLCGGSGQYS